MLFKSSGVIFSHLSNASVASSTAFSSGAPWTAGNVYAVALVLICVALGMRPFGRRKPFESPGTFGLDWIHGMKLTARLLVLPPFISFRVAPSWKTIL